MDGAFRYDRDRVKSAGTGILQTYYCNSRRVNLEPAKCVRLTLMILSDSVLQKFDSCIINFIVTINGLALVSAVICILSKYITDELNTSENSFIVDCMIHS